MLNQFSNLSCYEEFEIHCALTGISKVGVLNNIGHLIDDYYFFVSDDGIFNWYDLKGTHVENPNVLKEIKRRHIPCTITKCIIPNGVTRINDLAFAYYESLTEINVPDSVTYIGDLAFWNCRSLTSITIPNNVISIGTSVFNCCKSLKEVIFKGKTLDEVKRMDNYPFGIEDESIIKYV